MPGSFPVRRNCLVQSSTSFFPCCLGPLSNMEGRAFLTPQFSHEEKLPRVELQLLPHLLPMILLTQLAVVGTGGGGVEGCPKHPSKGCALGSPLSNQLACMWKLNNTNLNMFAHIFRRNHGF